MPPHVGPRTPEDAQHFLQLCQIQDAASSAVAWAISLGNDCCVNEVQVRILPLVLEKMTGVDPRALTGYGILLFFVEKVCQCLLQV